jgi:hypothetical protein
MASFLGLRYALGVPLLIPLLVLILVGALAIVISRGNELFFLSVRGGKVLLIRGRLPVALQHDLEDVITRARVQDASIRAVRSSGHARLVVSGVDEGTQQRLRNTLGVHPIQKLRNAPIATDRNMGQLMGLSWLAWMLRRR